MGFQFGMPAFGGSKLCSSRLGVHQEAEVKARLRRRLTLPPTNMAPVGRYLEDEFAFEGNPCPMIVGSRVPFFLPKASIC